MNSCEQEAIDFMNWFCDLDYPHKIFICGNHDDCLYGVEYNYKCVIAAEPSLMYNRIADGTSYPCLENETSKL